MKKIILLSIIATNICANPIENALKTLCKELISKWVKTGVQDMQKNPTLLDSLNMFKTTNCNTDFPYKEASDIIRRVEYLVFDENGTINKHAKVLEYLERNPHAIFWDDKGIEHYKEALIAELLKEKANKLFIANKLAAKDPQENK